MSERRVLVVGAGPIGLAAALGCVRRGLSVTVLEQGEVGASLRRWGPTRFFSPLALNLPADALPILQGKLPPGDALLTGREFAEDVLAPLARSAPLAGKVLGEHRVLAIQRVGMLRGDYAGHPLRGERPFQVLVDTPTGERRLEAEAVLDASGTYGQPVALGARGERAVAGQLIRHLGMLHERRRVLAGRRVLLLGQGHSAANAIVVLEQLVREAPTTSVVWATRAASLRPCVEVASDPLPERRHIVARANELGMRPPAWLRVERRAMVQSVERDREDTLRVSLSGPGERVVLADELIALTGYRPDLSFLAELSLDIAPATEGSAGLARALAHVTDCLSVPAVAPCDLASGEQGFHLLGAKSYGRARTFLLQTGYAQLETILDGLAAV